MKLLTGMRIGQSSGEFAAAVFFSLAFHVILLFGGILVVFRASPRTIPPITYHRVNLVDLPADAPLVPSAAQPAPQPPAPPVPKQQPKAQRTRRPAAARPAPQAAPKAAMPELSAEKEKKPVPTGSEAPSAAPRRQEAVSVSAGSGGQEFPFAPYVAIVRDKVERNWNPPPGAKGATVKVAFRVLRSGRVGDAKLLASSGNFYFDQAAMRAILASSPFPPLPEAFFRDSEMFSVDLIEKP